MIAPVTAWRWFPTEHSSKPRRAFPLSKELEIRFKRGQGREVEKKAIGEGYKKSRKKGRDRDREEERKSILELYGRNPLNLPLIWTQAWVG